METMIEVRQLCKSFVINKKQNHVLRNVDLSIHKGEFIAVMGPSGSGKSTLLYTISGMDHISSGTVEFDHKEISRYNEMEMAKLRLHEMGFIFQQMHFLNNLNIYDNVILPGYMAKKRKHKEINAYADEPTGALNSSNAKEVMDMFSKVHEQGTTILMVTHDVKVASYAQRICYINDGKIESNLDIGMLKHADELKEREKKVYNWLMEKGW